MRAGVAPRCDGWRRRTAWSQSSRASSSSTDREQSSRAEHAGVWAGRIARSVAPNGAATYVAVFSAATVILVLVARAYLVGQRGALAVVLGTTVLLAAVINDIGVASGAFSTVYLTDLGLAAFVIGIATTPGARYAAVTQELERRTEELRNRTRELRRSYEDLRSAQEELVKKEQLAVVGELAAVIAHEVRNPLAIIANAGAGLRKQAISREDHDTLLRDPRRRDEPLEPACDRSASLRAPRERAALASAVARPARTGDVARELEQEERASPSCMSRRARAASGETRTCSDRSSTT